MDMNLHEQQFVPSNLSVVCVHSCQIRGYLLLQNQHAIAVAIKSVTLANRFTVRFQQKFPAGECAHEHEQSRAREMKIRQKGIDDSKFKGWIDKQVGLSRIGANDAFVRLDCFKQS